MFVCFDVDEDDINYVHTNASLSLSLSLSLTHTHTHTHTSHSLSHGTLMGIFLFRNYNLFTCRVSIAQTLPPLALLGPVERCCTELFHTSLHGFHGCVTEPNRKTRGTRCIRQVFIHCHGSDMWRELRRETRNFLFPRAECWHSTLTRTLTFFCVCVFFLTQNLCLCLSVCLSVCLICQ